MQQEQRTTDILAVERVRRISSSSDHRHARAGTERTGRSCSCAPHAFKTGTPAVNHAGKTEPRPRNVTAEVSVRPSVHRLVVIAATAAVAAAAATWFLRQNYAADRRTPARRIYEWEKPIDRSRVDNSLVNGP